MLGTYPRHYEAPAPGRRALKNSKLVAVTVFMLAICNLA